MECGAKGARVGAASEGVGARRQATGGGRQAPCMRRMAAKSPTARWSPCVRTRCSRCRPVGYPAIPAPAHLVCDKQDLAAQRGLAGVHVANEHHVQVVAPVLGVGRRAWGSRVGRPRTRCGWRSKPNLRPLSARPRRSARPIAAALPPALLAGRCPRLACSKLAPRLHHPRAAHQGRSMTCSPVAPLASPSPGAAGRRRPHRQDPRAGRAQRAGPVERRRVRRRQGQVARHLAPLRGRPPGPRDGPGPGPAVRRRVGAAPRGSGRPRR